MKGVERLLELNQPLPAGAVLFCYAVDRHRTGLAETYAKG